MSSGGITLFYGDGKGKTTLAIGQGIRAVGEGLKVIMIQFLDYNNTKETIPLSKLEPDFRIFRFEKMRKTLPNVEDASRKEIMGELYTAFHFTKKILETGECDMLLLDGISDAIGENFISETELCELLDKRPESMELLLTGSNRYPFLVEKANYVYHITTEKRPSEKETQST